MFGFSGPHEMIIVILIIVVMWLTGLWPVVIRGIRELRGEHVDDSSYQNHARQQSTSSPPSRDNDLCYKMLGVSPSAPWDEIEKAYRRKAKLHHPDHGGDEDTMRALNDAYAQLKAIKGRR